MSGQAAVIRWNFSPFAELSARDLHDALHLRQQVFVLEQTCLFPEIDGKDPDALHLIGRDGAGDLLAYLRVFAPGDYYAEPAIGRVVVAPEARGRGLARVLMEEGHRRVATLFGPTPIRLNAQAYLKDFYESLGYAIVHGPYDEDGIPHYEMLRGP